MRRHQRKNKTKKHMINNLTFGYIVDTKEIIYNESSKSMHAIAREKSINKKFIRLMMNEVICYNFIKDDEVDICQQ